jgi:hypothetical protein
VMSLGGAIKEQQSTNEQEMPDEWEEEWEEEYDDETYDEGDFFKRNNRKLAEELKRQSDRTFSWEQMAAQARRIREEAEKQRQEESMRLRESLEGGESENVK